MQQSPQPTGSFIRNNSRNEDLVKRFSLSESPNPQAFQLNQGSSWEETGENFHRLQDQLRGLEQERRKLQEEKVLFSQQVELEKQKLARMETQMIQ